MPLHSLELMSHIPQVSASVPKHPFNTNQRLPSPFRAVEPGAAVSWSRMQKPDKRKPSRGSEMRDNGLSMTRMLFSVCWLILGCDQSKQKTMEIISGYATSPPRFGWNANKDRRGGQSVNLKHQFHPRRLGSSVQEESVVHFRSDILLKRELCCEDENKSQNAKRHFFFCIFFIWSCFFSTRSPTLSDCLDADGNLRESF